VGAHGFQAYELFGWELMDSWVREVFGWEPTDGPGSPASAGVAGVVTRRRGFSLV